MNSAKSDAITFPIGYMQTHNGKSGRGFRNLTGMKFGKWTVIGFCRHNKWGSVEWDCKCECGTDHIVSTANLKQGATTRCKRCQKKHGMAKTPTYWAWQAMITRCTNQSNKSWKYYGGRGIRVCEEWLGENGFENFFKCVGERIKNGTLDRFPDKNGNYEPGNVRWATMQQQNRNRRSTKLDPEKVESIRNLYATGFISLSSLGRAFSVTKGNIARIVKGLTWKTTNS